MLNVRRSQQILITDVRQQICKRDPLEAFNIEEYLKLTIVRIIVFGDGQTTFHPFDLYYQTFVVILWNFYNE